MRVESLSLQNFRNYERLTLSCPDFLNVFIGQNAQGKTNLLETMIVLATGRSLRAARDAEMVRWGAEEAHVSADIARELGPVRIEMRLRAGVGKRVLVNGNPLRRLADLFGYLNVVSFTPDDLQLVKGSPSYRRQFLDYEIAQVSPAYRDHLARYNRVLKQRNSLLRAIADGEASPAALEPWEPQLVEHGSRVIVKRAEMIASLSPLASEIHRRITQGSERLTLEYRPFFLAEDEPVEEGLQDLDHVRLRFVEKLHRLRRAEIQRGTSLVGPQRDDVLFKVNGVDARIFGSQGQQRTTVLSCKLAEIRYMEEQVGEPPVLLLDDVMSELDASRRSFLVGEVQDRVQTFITSAYAGDLGESLLARARLFHIRQGQVYTPG